MISEGDSAPHISLPTAGGGTTRMDVGRLATVLFFYPKADTSGCTRQAQDFSAALPDFTSIGAAVIGISPDPLPALEKFRAKHGLAVTLASDESRSAIEPFGVWGEKSMYGKTYMGVDRSTFLLDGEGTVARVWRKVKVPGHVAEVLAAARELTRA